MSMKNNEQVMMEADYSPGDAKLVSEARDKNGQDVPLGSDPENSFDDKKRKKRRRRHKGGKNHRKWKPYDKMSFTEKKRLEEKESRRANQKREEAFASGHPVAPYNTTQFLMDDHCQSEAISPDLHRHNSKDSNNSNVSESSSSVSDDEFEDNGFQATNFLESYETYNQERLMSMTKEELIGEYVKMETKLEKLENNREPGSRLSRDSSEGQLSSSAEETVDIGEYSRLKEENEKLKEMNSKLRKELDSKKIGDAS